MEYRRAVAKEYPQIRQMYKAAIRAMGDSGIYQWDDIYPSEEILDDIENEEMYIGLLDGIIAITFTLNRQHNEEYENGRWVYKGQRFLVVHRVCVNPELQNTGIATQTMRYIEEKLKKEGYESIRLDAFSKNPPALRLYENSGYSKVGEIHLRKGLFYLFEKQL